MADNQTPIAVPGQTDDAEAALAGAVQATAQAADQHVEPGATAAVPAGPAAPAEGDSKGGPLGLVISTQ
jgi:hypothetical protein